LAPSATLTTYVVPTFLADHAAPLQNSFIFLIFLSTVRTIVSTQPFFRVGNVQTINTVLEGAAPITVVKASAYRVVTGARCDQATDYGREAEPDISETSSVAGLRHRAGHFP